MTKRTYAGLLVVMILYLMVPVAARADTVEGTFTFETSDELVSLRIHGATPDFVGAVEALGYRGVSIDRLLAMRIHGVSPKYIRAFIDLGYDPAVTKSGPGPSREMLVL